MRISRNFRAKSIDGQISISAQLKVPLPIKIHSAALEMPDCTDDPGAKTFNVNINGETIFAGQTQPGKELMFKPPIRLPMGQPTLSLTSTPYPPGEKVAGRVHLKISIF